MGNKYLEKKEVALITSSGGHGFMELGFATAYKQKPIAFSEKDNQDDFEKEVEDIYNRLSPFVPNMTKASWENRDTLLAKGVSYRKKLLAKEINQDMWNEFAKVKLLPHTTDDLPKFKGLKTYEHNVLMIPQKLFSDGLCNLTATQQSVPLEVFDFLKQKDSYYVLGQHFHAKNDLAHVENIANEFNMYVPGKNEDNSVFGIRGVNHTQYLNMYKKIDMSVGIAGTHTWYMLECFPEIPQIILYNKEGAENWNKIAQAYLKQKPRKPIYVLGFDKNTDWEKFSETLQKLYDRVSAPTRKKNLDLQKTNVAKQERD